MVTTEQQLIETLKGKQRVEGLNESDFAKKLGIDRRLWGLTKNGQANIGMSLLKAVMRVYPELSSEVLALLRDSEKGSVNGK
jgi:hypothetical protein